MTDANWYADPLGAAELRYFDGTNWTDHVTTGGQQWVHPYPPPPAPPQPEQPRTGLAPVALHPQVMEPPPSTAATNATMGAASTTVLWEGERQSLTAAASGGRIVSGKYRITQDALHFEAGLLSTKAESVPLWYVLDVDMKQSLTQKSRGVGDLAVRLDPAGTKFGQQVVVLESIRDPRSVRDLLVGQANEMRRRFLDSGHQREIERRQAGATQLNTQLNVGTPQQAPPPSAPELPPTARPAESSGLNNSSMIDQLKQLGELRDAGVLTEDEFQQQKARVLGS